MLRRTVHFGSEPALAALAVPKASGMPEGRGRQQVIDKGESVTDANQTTLPPIHVKPTMEFV